MKKIFLVFIALFTSLILVGCVNEVKDITVTFDSDGGSAVLAQPIKSGGNAAYPTAPTRLDYEFQYWSDASLAVPVGFDFNQPLKKDIILKAVWKYTGDGEEPINKKKFEIKFFDGATELTSIQKVEDSILLLSETPYTKVGMSLDAWFTNQALTIKYDMALKITGTLTLYGKWMEVTYDEYYAGIAGKTGSSLTSALNTIITSMTPKTYGDIRGFLGKADINPNNPSKLLSIYDNAALNPTWDSGATWNREHVWPQSMLQEKADNGTANQASDAHNLRACTTNTNSNRGNLAFVDGAGVDGKRTGSGYYPGDRHRGDVARILLYMKTRYNALNLGSVGSLELLVRWHKEDPVDEFEILRNNHIFDFQKNRNPYIDHPELVELAFGSSSFMIPAMSVFEKHIQTTQNAFIFDNRVHI